MENYALTFHFLDKPIVACIPQKNVKEAQRKRGEPEVGISIEGYILKL